MCRIEPGPAGPTLGGAHETMSTDTRDTRGTRTFARSTRREMELLSRDPQNRVLAGLVFLLGTLTMALVLWSEALPVTALLVPLLLGSLWLGPRFLNWFVVANLAAVLPVLLVQRSLDARTAGAIIVMFTLGFIILLSSFNRSRLGVAGFRGESMLVDLRDRILSQGRLPELPAGWDAQLALRSAGGSPFAGDFVVAGPADQERLEVAVVDVSGKGEQAGTRALMLSGAFGGLLSALGPGKFLGAANHYLLRQQWPEGFATAVHLSLDLRSGEYEVRTAGHPPALHLHAADGTWDVLESSGPILGVVPHAGYVPAYGRLEPDDALLLYTDGLVEVAGRDIGLGIDRLVGSAEQEMGSGFEGAASRLVDALGSHNDDRALLLVRRR